MKKYLLIAATILLCAAILCSCNNKSLSGTYTFGEGVHSAEVTLNEDGSFEFVFSPISSYLGIGKFTISGDRLTLRTSDGQYHYVFRITDNGIEFDADASSDILWFGEFADGSLFKKS